jgi:DNA-binding NarL/FixJ family response regulator
MYEIMTGLKALNPTVRIIATIPSRSDEMALRALCAGAEGYIEESATAGEFEAIRVVNKGQCGHLGGYSASSSILNPKFIAYTPRHVADRDLRCPSRCMGNLRVATQRHPHIQVSRE